MNKINWFRINITEYILDDDHDLSFFVPVATLTDAKRIAEIKIDQLEENFPHNQYQLEEVVNLENPAEAKSTRILYSDEYQWADCGQCGKQEKPTLRLIDDDSEIFICSSKECQEFYLDDIVMCNGFDIKCKQAGCPVCNTHWTMKEVQAYSKKHIDKNFNLKQLADFVNTQDGLLDSERLDILIPAIQEYGETIQLTEDQIEECFKQDDDDVSNFKKFLQK